jgi:hypothetical protein
LIFVRGFILGTDVDDTIRINVEGNFDLRNTTRRRRKAEKLEVTKDFVVLDKFTFTLEDFDFDSSLAIGGSGEDLGFFGGDSGVTGDETGEDTSESFDTEGERSNVEEEDIRDITRQHRPLDCGTNSNGFIRID